MSAEVAPHRSARPALSGLVAAAHPGPCLAVTILAGLLAVAQGLSVPTTALVAAAVLAGQLSIGWSNDLLDRDRDRLVGRTDKPLASGALGTGTARLACASALVVCVVLSLACGTAAGLVHLGCVAAGWSYNLGLKATAWSWLPYAVAFGGLTLVVSLAATPSALPPWWWPAGAALLGIAAHLLNALPDLDDDASTGVRGLPHRIGPRGITVGATFVLVAANVVVLVGAAPPVAVALGGGAVAGALAVVVLTGRGRTPFAAAVAIALVDVVLLVVTR